jgi:uncharacterized protein
MRFSNQLKTGDGAGFLSSEPCRTDLGRTSRMGPVLVGPHGLRAGWRLLIFLTMIALLVGALFLIGHARGGRTDQITVTPRLLIPNDGILLLIVGGVTWVMARIERRRFSQYGLPFRLALRKDFWIGSVMGFLTISGTLAVMFLLHGFRITGLALHGTAILSSLAGWAVAFFLSGLFEEFAFRGYVQYTLSSGIGFWPAAVVMSSAFGLGHLVGDPNENVVGSVAVVLFGLLLCLFLRRTGTLWCAVGFHVAYDWGQMFYGVPDSGIVPYHNLLNSAFSGPHWFTGGKVGPEASVCTPIALLVVALLFSRYYRQNRYQVDAPLSS